MQRIIKPELKFVASPALLGRGCVIVIGLEAIRDEAGARWDKTRHAIYLNLESFLRQKLGGTDYFSQRDLTGSVQRCARLVSPARWPVDGTRISSHWALFSPRTVRQVPTS
jgi:hypothetical protein